MKSTDVYAELKKELAAPLTAAGFKREKTFLSWSRPSGGQHTVVWCQVSRDGWDAFAGSEFVVELQRSSEPTVGAQGSRRQRIGGLLLEADREEARRIHHAVIAELQPAPASHHNLHVSADVTKWYLQKFEQQDPFASSDFWFRYASPEHVARWARFLSQRLVALIGRFESATAQ